MWVRYTPHSHRVPQTWGSCQATCVPHVPGAANLKGVLPTPHFEGTTPHMKVRTS